MRAVYSNPEMGLGDGLLQRFVAANLSFYLAERGLDQRQFAKEVKASEATVSRWLSGERLPKDRYWPRILIALDCEMEDLTRDPAGPRKKVQVVPDKDKEPVIRFLRKQANQLGYDLTKLPVS